MTAKRTYSSRNPELQQRAEALKAAGRTYPEIAKELGVCYSTARRLADPVAREERNKDSMIRQMADTRAKAPVVRRLLSQGWDQASIMYFTRLTEKQFSLLLSEGLF